jgi:hypothetical protein
LQPYASARRRRPGRRAGPTWERLVDFALDRCNRRVIVGTEERKDGKDESENHGDVDVIENYV